jgi:hypothetical protein
MVVQEFGQLLAETFVALALVTEHDGPLEQGMLKLLRQIAPKVGRGRTQNKKVSLRVFGGNRVIRWFAHGKTRARVEIGWTLVSGRIQVANRPGRVQVPQANETEC